MSRSKTFQKLIYSEVFVLNRRQKQRVKFGGKFSKTAETFLLVKILFTIFPDHAMNCDNKLDHFDYFLSKTVGTPNKGQLIS